MGGAVSVPGSISNAAISGDEAAEILVMAEVLEAAPEWMTLVEVKRLLRLDQLGSDEFLTWLSAHVDGDGSLTKAAMTTGLMKMASTGGALDEETSARVELAISTLFDAFDANKDGTVSERELKSGLALMAAGDRTSKFKAAFAAYDTDGNGTITLDEMVTMLQSIYRVAYSADGSNGVKTGVDPDTLASVTAEACFASADRDRDGLLTFEEFESWASGGVGAAPAPVSAATSASSAVASEVEAAVVAK